MRAKRPTLAQTAGRSRWFGEKPVEWMSSANVVEVVRFLLVAESVEFSSCLRTCDVDPGSSLCGFPLRTPTAPMAAEFGLLLCEPLGG